jgi:hypothetical protein
MPYSTLFSVAFVSHMFGDWTHHSFGHILLVSLIFATAFTLTWAGCDLLSALWKERRSDA